MITVLYFASIKEKLGRARETVALPAEVTTVAALATWLGTRGTAWREALASPSLKVAVNQNMSALNAPLRDGDEVAFFPPVTGG
jgi:molybdopterin synthase sulfur carrier subunit